MGNVIGQALDAYMREANESGVWDSERARAILAEHGIDKDFHRQSHLYAD